jgi:threonine dehydratase
MLALDDTFGGTGWFKLEYLQHTGTFKARGAFNRIISASDEGSLDPSVGVVVASAETPGLRMRSQLARWASLRRCSFPKAPRP